MRRHKIAIVHQHLIAAGGSETRALWIAEALKDDFDVSLLTMGNPEIEDLNSYYGTNLNVDEIKIINFPVPKLLKNHFDALRAYKLIRYCKHRSSAYDLMISTYNVMDFGKKGIQFIADFSFDDNLRLNFNSLGDRQKKIFHIDSLFRKIYLRIGKFLSGTSLEGWKFNLTVANSNWSSRVLEDAFGIKAQVVYPPVPGEFNENAWDDRENGFVFLGRLTPEKEADKIIGILGRLEKKGFKIHFHMFGKVDNSAYVKKLKELCNKNHDWCFIEGVISGERKRKFLACHKYGISGRRNEPFGIAVAEMIKAGCIVWVPNGGGQIEIVNHPELIYDNIDDAMKKIMRVLESNVLQAELREHLAKQAEKFSAERFKAEAKKIVRQFFKDQQSPNRIK